MVKTTKRWRGLNYLARVAFAILARVTGLEPATSGVTGRRSNQLSYTRISVDGGVKGYVSIVKRILYKTRHKSAAMTKFMKNRKKLRKIKEGIGGDGFEPPTLSV